MANQLDAATLTALTNALTAFTAAIAAGGVAGGAAGAAAAPPAVPATTDLHSGIEPYDLNKRNGLAAYDEAKAALPFMFDGSNATYPNLIHALQQRIRVCNWNPMITMAGADDTPAASNIITIGTAPDTKNILDMINQITDAELEAARVTRAGGTNERAKQNAKCMYLCLASSLTGNIHSVLFSQPGNLPKHMDGPLLLKRIATFTTIYTLPSAVTTGNALTNMDPAKYGFNIIKINKELSRLFVLYSQGPFGSVMTDEFRLFYMLQAYDKIKRPMEWSTSVSDWKRQQTSKTLKDPLVLSAEAQNKFLELECFTGNYKASTQRIQESVVAMLSKIANKKPASQNEETPKKEKANESDKEAEKEKKIPPFVTHARKPRKDGGGDYKEGDTREWNGKTWNFHPATTHRDKKRWFVHAVPDCLTCRKFKTNDTASANNTDNDDSTPDASAISDLSDDPPLETLLAQAFDMAQGSPQADMIQSFLSDALSALQEE